MKGDMKALWRLLGLSFALVVLLGFVVGVLTAVGWLDQEAATYVLLGGLLVGVLVIWWLAPIPLTPIEEKPVLDVKGDAEPAGGSPGQQETSATVPMVNKPVGLKDLLASGSWYAIPALCGLFALFLVAIRLPHLFFLAAGIGFAVYILVVVVYAMVFEQRFGMRPHPERVRVFSARVHGPIFSVIWSAFAAGCVAAALAVIHVNDAFSTEAVNRVVDASPWLFWGAVAAGAALGVFPDGVFHLDARDAGEGA